MARNKGKILGVFSAKGGVGKSTTVINLAGVFSSFDKKILIIDFDMTSGAIAAILNKNPRKTIYTFVDDYTNGNADSLSNYAIKYNDNIDLLAAPVDPRQGAQIGPEYIETILGKLSFDYDIIICDTNHLINEFNITLLDKCDEILLCMTNDLVDIKNMRNLVKVFKDAEKKNYFVMLNEYIHPYKKYYSLYDIKNVIKHNVDYVISSNFFLKSYDSYVSDGKIITLESKMKRVYPSIYKAYVSVYDDLMEEENGK